METKCFSRGGKYAKLEKRECEEITSKKGRPSNMVLLKSTGKLR